MNPPCRRRGGLIRSLLAVVLCAFVAAATAADALETGQFRIQTDAQGDVAELEVRSGAGPGDWRSLVSRDATGAPLSRHFALYADPRGAPLRLLEAAGESFQRVVVGADGDLRVRQELAPGEEPFRLRLVIEVESPRAGTELPDRLYLQLGPGLGEVPMPGLGIATGLYSYVEGLVHPGRGTERFRLGEPGEREEVAIDAWPEGSWAGLNSRYFALLVSVTDGSAPDRVEFELPADAGAVEPRYLPRALIGLPLAGQPLRWELEVFAGPKSRTALAAGDAADFSELLFHGLWRWMRGLSFGLLRLLELIYGLIPNWGLAICLLAVVVRLALYPLARWALNSQQRFAEIQREIQPAMREIKQRYKGAEQSERILKLYEEHDISPLAGLKPLLIVAVQIPVFVALFHVLGQAYELRDASFLWMESLSEPDRLFPFGIDLPFFGAWFNLLPVLMALSTLATIKLSPAPAATEAERRRQNVFLGLMALAFFLLFYPFPSGMVLYWTVANVLHVAQARMFRPATGARPAES